VKLIDPKWKENGIVDYDKTKQYLGSYLYSSYLDYINIEGKNGKILNKLAFPEYFINFKEFEKFIDEWMVFKK